MKKPGILPEYLATDHKPKEGISLQITPLLRFLLNTKDIIYPFLHPALLVLKHGK